MRAGAAVYHPLLLHAYDPLVSVNCRFAWGCPRSEILAQYRAAVGANHLEVGVGSGYLPANTVFPGQEPRITLCDLNPNTLAHAARRLPDLSPRLVRANALEPLTQAGLGEGEFDSVALNLLLHCVPGDFREKEAVLANAAAVTRPGGTVQGSTLLSEGVPLAGKPVMALFNTFGVFHNRQDRYADLKAVLDNNFDSYELTVLGCAALFTATVPGSLPR
ncbi:methyltransferase family protein [Tamaricihabitans halophyticus]|uniref:Methyltransferase family protein n=1 Tax=Tamaricihabitans halophyticus TaxID=1262583 RepID=A0A4R2QZ55_9PSEU|nr:methyltransferase family protein [Tamaricihabitans halophyticus]